MVFSLELAITMLYKNTRSLVISPNGATDMFDMKAVVLSLLFIITLYCFKNVC